MVRTAACITLTCLHCTSLAQAILFEDVTAEAGIDYTGESWGASWGDFNGDGYLDLWVSNHGQMPFLLINQQDGTFVDIATSALPADVLTYYNTVEGSYDMHGAVWFDYDRDGDLDLFQAADGGIRMHPNHLYLNDNGVAFQSEAAVSAGVALPHLNSTMPLVFDWNSDGASDIFTASNPRIAIDLPITFSQRDPLSPTFQDVTAAIGIAFDGPTKFGRVTDFDDDGHIELLVGPTPETVRLYEFDAATPTDVTAQYALGVDNSMVDAVVADFDGDLDDDIFLVRGESTLGLVQVAPNRVEASVSVNQQERGISFKSNGDVTFELFPVWQVPTSRIFIGAGGLLPTATRFTLSAANPDHHGIAPHTPGVDRGHYVGYDPGTETWTVLLSYDSYAQRNISADTVETATDAQPIGFFLGQSTPSDRFFTNDDGVFVNETIARGFGQPTSGRNIGAGDFDNDGDVDLYIVSTGPVENRPNRLYLNDGNANFSLHPDGAGAAGGTAGRGDAVAVADYDNDGFLDLFVTNGKDKPPFFFDGPYYLFRNGGNDNNYLQVELNGVTSPAMGAGAVVQLTSPSHTQRQVQGGGVHYRAQDMQRVHFGLGIDSVVHTLDVRWPSGAVQRFAALLPNQIFSVTEPVAQVDSDGDGLLDDVDNCSSVANAAQTDTDLDGFGNRCDTDLNNDCTTNALDLGLLRNGFFSSDPLLDFDGNGVVNAVDLGIMKDAFFAAPGPSGTRAECTA